MRHNENDITGVVHAILEAHASTPDSLLSALHAIQDALGYVPSETDAMLADALNLSRAELHGVISFYHDFRTTPPAKHVVRVCCAEACQSVGSDRVLAHTAKSADSKIEIAQVYCLGHCAASPSVLIDDTPYARVTPDRLDKLNHDLKEAA